MKQDKMKELIYVLKNSTTWISSVSLSKMIGVSERTIRNYINELNQGDSYEVVSSKNGYQLKEIGIPQTPMDDLMDERSNFVLSNLFSNPSGCSIFDLAEELCVSESTILNSVLPKVKKLLATFHIQIKSHDYLYSLIGSEQDKRKLIGYIASHNIYGYFSSTNTLRKLFPSFNIDEVLQNLFELCQESNLFLNNYSLNNLLVHILIIIIRLESKHSLSSSQEQIDADTMIMHFHQKDKILQLANDISAFFSSTYGSTIPLEDFKQIVILIALSVERYDDNELDFETLSTFIDQQFLDHILQIADEMCQRYELKKFDPDFLLQFCLHMYNVYQRSTYHISYPNPIANQIKKDYAPIYDMAVFFAHRFSLLYHMEINDDEIAFIAFHIGAYLERDKEKKGTIRCIIIVENYHNFANNMVNELETTFQEEMTIVNVMSLNRYMMMKPDCELLLTTIQLLDQHPHTVLINPILTKQNMRQIWKELEEIEEEKKTLHAKVFLQRMLRPELYIRNIQQSDETSYIEYMGKLCLKHHYVQADFIKDVLVRESVSSTAFTDCLAVPHAINQYADSSFICVLHNDTAIPWGKHQVNFVLMIGVAEADMKYFNDAFHLIIDSYSSMDKTIQLLHTTSFQEFKKTLISF